jgi:tetratricopeptide (TPR) repeat protein
MFACAIFLGRSLRRAVLEAIPFAVISLALCGVTIYFQSQLAIATDVIRTDRVASRIAIAGRAVWFYLGKLIWPTPLSFVYPRWTTGDVSARAFLPLLLLGVLFLILWIGQRKWTLGPLLALFYFVLMLLPMLGLLNIYFMRYSLVADHWQYAASLGPIALLAATISRVKSSIKWVLGAIVLLPLIILSERQSLLYRSGELLWRDTIAKNPTSWMAQMNLGHTLVDEHRFAEAEGFYRAAIALAPDLAEPYYSLASAEAQQGRFADAVVKYQKAIDINPRIASMYLDMGHSFAELKQFDRALDCYQKAVALQSNDSNLRYQLGILLEQMNRRDAAIDAYQSAVSIDPDFASAQYHLGKCLMAENRIPEAVVHLRAAATASNRTQ